MVTLEAVDEVIRRTGKDYEIVKLALEETDNDVLDALVLLEERDARLKAKEEEKRREKERKKKTHKIVVKKDDRRLAAIPLKTGVVGVAAGLLTNPVVVGLSAYAAHEFGLKFSIEKSEDRK